MDIPAAKTRNCHQMGLPFFQGTPLLGGFRVNQKETRLRHFVGNINQRQADMCMTFVSGGWQWQLKKGSNKMCSSGCQDCLPVEGEAVTNPSSLALGALKPAHINPPSISPTTRCLEASEIYALVSGLPSDPLVKKNGKDGHPTTKPTTKKLRNQMAVNYRGNSLSIS